MNSYSAAALMAEADAKAKLAEIEARSKKANSLAALQARITRRKKEKTTKAGIHGLGTDQDGPVRAQSDPGSVGPTQSSDAG